MYIAESANKHTLTCLIYDIIIHHKMALQNIQIQPQSKLAAQLYTQVLKYKAFLPKSASGC